MLCGLQVRLFCAHNELDGKSFFDEYCMDYAPTKEEDGIINAGYAVWRECIAEIIAIELDDCCEIVPLEEKKDVLRQLRSEIEPVDGKLLVSEILTAVMTSSEIEASQTWADAEKAICEMNLFETPPEMDLFRLVYAQLRSTLFEIDIDFIHELGYLYLNILSLAVIRNLHHVFVLRNFKQPILRDYGEIAVPPFGKALIIGACIRKPHKMTDTP